MTQMNLSMKQKQTHRHREQIRGCQWETHAGRLEWESSISMCKLLYIGWINNKVLLYSTGNCIQYSVINHNGKKEKYSSAWRVCLLPSRLRRVRLCATPWTAAYQASPAMGFSRQEHWSGLLFPSPMQESGK